MKRILQGCVLLMLTAVFIGCKQNNGNIIKEIHIGLHNNNELKIQVNVSTAENTDNYIEYWPAGNGAKIVSTSLVSANAKEHRFVLCNIAPKTAYKYRVVTVNSGSKAISKTYDFKSGDLPMYLQEQFKASSIADKQLPDAFKQGLMLINKRYAPGIAFLVDRKGQIRWYHMVDGLGFKVMHFTPQQTILSIMGKNSEQTSYGSEILELNLSGDTVLHLKKGQGDFKQTIHHEIIRNGKGQLVTIYVDNRVMDLSAVGGGKKDTVAGDGILVMDNTGRQIYRWSVFDVLDPLKDPKILKTKKDWMHANSLNFDKDGNYLLSFYNNGQIWKVNATTGKLIWKFGKGGDIAMPAECTFTQAHAVHINAEGNLMFFDNGVEKHQSEVYALKINEQQRSSTIDLHFKLPQQVFNGRMGSAYMINDTAVLSCCSKRHIIVLTNRKGTLLWTLETSVPTYRAEYITGKQLAPYLKP